MFCYVFIVFCYVLLCFAMFCYVFAMFLYVLPCFCYVLLCFAIRSDLSVSRFSTSASDSALQSLPRVQFSGSAVRLPMNNFKVDGLTRALTRQPSFSSLDFRFPSFPAGSREDFSRRIRICGPKCSILTSRGLTVGKTTL